MSSEKRENVVKRRRGLVEANKGVAVLDEDEGRVG